MLAKLQTPTYDVKPQIDEEALERLKRDYLPQWAALAYGSAVGRGFPTEVPYVDYMRASVSMGRSREEPDHWVCNVINKAILEVTPKIPAALAALSARYVKGAQAPDPKVFRSNRTGEAVALYWIDDVADAAEEALVPVCRRMGLPI